MLVTTCLKDVPVYLKTTKTEAISRIRCTLEDFK